MFKLRKNILKSINLKDKIRVFMMLTICASFLFFSIATNYIYKNLFNKYTSQLIIKNFNLTHSDFEKIIANSKNACTIIENDEKIYSIISMENDFIHEAGKDFYENFGTYIYMQNTLVFSSSTYDVDGISLYTNSGYLYGDQGKTHFNTESLKESKWYNYMQSTQEISMLCNADYFSSEEQVQVGDLYYIKQIRSKRTGKYIGAIRITISKNRIEDLLQSNSSNLINTTFLKNEIGEALTSVELSKTNGIDVNPSFIQKLEYKDNKIIAHQKITGTNLALISVTSYKDAISDFNKIRFLIYIITLIIIFISYKLSKIFSIGITKRLNKMMNSMDDVKHGILQLVPAGDYYDDIELCINNYNDMLLEFESLLDTQKKNETQKRNLQLKILQEQIKPHFLYNTLELINNSAIINNIPEVSEIVLELSSYYRLSLSQGSETHTLKDELQHISLYFSLQNKRAQKPLTFNINAPDELLSTEIPKLLLQPIMENSYYHAFPLPITKKDSRIEVSVKKIDDDIIIEFYDNGIGIPYDKQKNIFETESKSGFGLKNINERIKLFSGNNYGITISSIPNVETIVKIKLPYNTNNTNEFNILGL